MYIWEYVGLSDLFIAGGGWKSRKGSPEVGQVGDGRQTHAECWLSLSWTVADGGVYVAYWSLTLSWNLADA